MKKVEQIRNALALQEDAIDLATLSDATGISNIGSHIAGMVKTGEVRRRDSGGKLWFSLNPDYKPVRQRKLERTLPIKRKRKAARKAKKRAGAMPKRKKVSLRDIATRAAERTPLRELARDNYIAAAEHLVESIRNQVSGLDSNPILVAAIDQHDRAAALLKAAA